MISLNGHSSVSVGRHAAKILCEGDLFFTTYGAITDFFGFSFAAPGSGSVPPSGRQHHQEPFRSCQSRLTRD